MVGFDPVVVSADAGQLEQVLLNLAINARDAMPTGGRLFVESSIATLTEQRRVRTRDGGTVPLGTYGVLTVSDTGLGMDTSTLAHAFEPFFTTKEAGKGTGLGLSTVQSIVQQSGGQIVVKSEPGAGTTFSIYLPISDGQVAAPSVPASAPIRIVPSRTVLLVEDEAAVRSLVRKVLTRAGMTVLDTSGPEDALQLMGRFKGVIDLLLTDVVMSCYSGPELASRLRVRFPEMPVVYMSGYGREEGGYRRLPQDAVFLQKPFSPEELIDTVSVTLGKQARVGTDVEPPMMLEPLQTVPFDVEPH